MNTPLVSIVIANYNYGRFLDESIPSALGQSYGNVEVIVVDDGSSDDSIEVAKRHSVRVIEQTNSGVARARNRGAREARGELLVFLDADDILAPDYVERCWNVLRHAPRDVAYVYTEAERFGLQTGPLGTRPFDGRALFMGNFVPVTTLLRKRAFDEAGGFDATWPAYEAASAAGAALRARVLRRIRRRPVVPYCFHGRSRNTLTEDQLDDLHVRLVLRYPRHGLRWMIKKRRAFLRGLLRRLRQARS